MNYIKRGFLSYILVEARTFLENGLSNRYDLSFPAFYGVHRPKLTPACYVNRPMLCKSFKSYVNIRTSSCYANHARSLYFMLLRNLQKMTKVLLVIF